MRCACIAQLVEQLTLNQLVPGRILVRAPSCEYENAVPDVDPDPSMPRLTTVLTTTRAKFSLLEGPIPRSRCPRSGTQKSFAISVRLGTPAPPLASAR